MDEKDMVHNAAKDVPRNVLIDGKRTNENDINLYSVYWKQIRRKML